MIVKIFHIIETAINRIRQQNCIKPSFAKQEEFCFKNPLRRDV
jgi:hypothetical protein